MILKVIKNKKEKEYNVDFFNFSGATQDLTLKVIAAPGLKTIKLNEWDTLEIRKNGF